MKAEELDKKFDDGEDVLDLFDLSTDREPARLDIDRQSIIKFWLGEHLEKSA
jgi:hypothetical protein